MMLATLRSRPRAKPVDESPIFVRYDGTREAFSLSGAKGRAVLSAEIVDRESTARTLADFAAVRGGASGAKDDACRVLEATLLGAIGAERVLYVGLLEVDERRRREGIGRRIWTELLDAARILGLGEAWLYACYPAHRRDEKLRPIQFWSACGFEIVHRTEWDTAIMRRAIR